MGKESVYVRGPNYYSSVGASYTLYTLGRSRLFGRGSNYGRC